MDEIRPWLFIGNSRDTLDRGYLRRHSIQAMLQLAMEVEIPEIETLYLPVEDFAPLNPDLLMRGVDFIREHKRQNHRVLVACAAGINRSSAYCTAALKEEEGLTLFDAFKAVRRRHPESMPIEPVWESLCNYYNDTTPYLELMRLGVSFEF